MSACLEALSLLSTIRCPTSCYEIDQVDTVLTVIVNDLACNPLEIVISQLLELGRNDFDHICWWYKIQTIPRWAVTDSFAFIATKQAQSSPSPPHYAVYFSRVWTAAISYI